MGVLILVMESSSYQTKSFSDNSKLWTMHTHTDTHTHNYLKALENDQKQAETEGGSSL